MKNIIKKLTLYSLVFAVLSVAMLPAVEVLAAPTVVISDIKVSRTDRTATILWQTNRNTTGKVSYGTASRDYRFNTFSSASRTNHAVTLNNLNPDTTYYFQIVAEDGGVAVLSFEQQVKTLKPLDNTAPIISDVRIVHSTGSTATIQWTTDEPASSEVKYGLTPDYGASRTDGRLKKVHDITLTGLKDGTLYNFTVISKDYDKNIAQWHNVTFRTILGTSLDKTDPVIYSVTPASENDPKVTQTTAVISWRSNNPMYGTVRYGTSPASLNKNIATNEPRDFVQNVTLSGLTPGTTYYYEIEIVDVLNKRLKSTIYSFTTKAQNGSTVVNNPTPVNPNNGGQVLGISSCALSLLNDSGYYGSYYNLPSSHPDVEKWKQDVKIAGANDWYSSQYLSFTRVDKSLDFGNNFFPITTALPGDPNHFAVYWRAMIYVPESTVYRYTISSDDDSWVIIDGIVENDLKGIHPARVNSRTVTLNAGYHKLEIYYADRQAPHAVMSFVPDAKWKIYPLPTNCEINTVLASTQNGNNNNNNNAGGVPPQVLGDKVNNNNNTATQAYACNPNLGYTKFTAVYKTANSPDVWAILETGQKHYISSPQAFAKYGCSWNEIKTVSTETLNKYPSARLVRTISDPTIHYLFQRPQAQWLKINITSPTVFISYPGNFWGNVARVDASDINAYPTASLIKVAGSPQVYKLEGSVKRLIPNETVFKKYNFHYAEVVEINQIHFDSYRTGSAID